MLQYFSMNKTLLLAALIAIFIAGALILPRQNSTNPPTDQTLGLASSPSQSQSYDTNTIPQISVTLIPSEGTISPTQTQMKTESLETAEKAIIKTSKGQIELELFPDVAPKTVAYLVKKAKSGFYNNLTFHRVEDWVIQGGDPLGNGTGGGNMPVEFNNKPFGVGAVGVASRGDGKVQNDAQFFITKTDASWLNGQYTNFGQVTKGMDVVEKIEIGDKILGITVE